MPRTKSDNAFTNLKEWLDTAIKISGLQHGGTFESAYRITNHLIKFYKDSFLAACQTQGVPAIKPMSATEFQSMLHAGKVSKTGERKLKKHLSSHLGQGFCPTQRSVNMLLEGLGVVHYSSCDFTYNRKRSQNLSSGHRRILTRRYLYIYRGTYLVNWYSHPMLFVFRLSLVDIAVTQHSSLVCQCWLR
jgi:hypothetical protein